MMRPLSELNRSTLLRLMLAQAVTLIPLMLELPIWIFLVWLVAAVWRVQIYRGALPYPGMMAKIGAVLVVLAVIRLSFSSVFAVDTLVAFLLLAFSIKLIEVHTRKDAVLLINVGFLALSTYFIFSQSLLAAVYFLLALLFLLQVWMGIYRERELAYFAALRPALMLLLQSLPLLIVLFIALPRLGQLWRMPTEGMQARTGFSDFMAPGDFSSLIQSNEVAFRVSFSDSASKPKGRELYWRALVLEHFDGKRWDRAPTASNVGGRTARGSQLPSSWQLSVPPQSRSVSYLVLLEPHSEDWLFTLTAPVQADSPTLKLRFTPLVGLKSRDPVISRAEYSVTSVLDYALAPQSLDGRQREIDLQLPKVGNPRSRALASTWRNEVGSGEGSTLQLIEKAKAFYRDSFTYTLKPPALGNNSVDEFLFSSQRGFCEHFAGSFVYLMRAAGVPARVVVGYQGGEFNHDYLIVRQRDAHAWAEVWIPNLGWRRVDPTAAVAPERIELGLEEAVGANEMELVGGFYRNNAFGRGARWLQMQADAIGYAWHRWVLDYDDDTQEGFFQNIMGGADAWRIGLFFLLGSAIALFLFLASSGMFAGSRYRYRENRYYGQHLARLRTLGFEKLASESPLAFARRVSLERPEWSPLMFRIAHYYCALAYAGESRQLENLKRSCRQFKRQVGVVFS